MKAEKQSGLSTYTDHQFSLHKVHNVIIMPLRFVAQLSLASKLAANGYTPYHKINKLGMHIRKEMWLT